MDSVLPRVPANSHCGELLSAFSFNTLHLVLLIKEQTFDKEVFFFYRVLYCGILCGCSKTYTTYALLLWAEKAKKENTEMTDMSPLIWRPGRKGFRPVTSLLESIHHSNDTLKCYFKDQTCILNCVVNWEGYTHKRLSFIPSGTDFYSKIFYLRPQPFTYSAANFGRNGKCPHIEPLAIVSGTLQLFFKSLELILMSIKVELSWMVLLLKSLL